MDDRKNNPFRPEPVEDKSVDWFPEIRSYDEVMLRASERLRAEKPRPVPTDAELEECLRLRYRF